MIIKDKISVIIPFYNSEETIIQSIKSVLDEVINSNYDWELILVDDGSKDNTYLVVEEYINTLVSIDNIKLLKQENKGAAAARNTGIRASTGEYIAFNDSDDYWLSGKLKLQLDYLYNNPDVVLVGGVFGLDDANAIKKFKYENVISIKQQIFKNYFTPQAVLLRKEVLFKSGLFNEKMRHSEEVFFFNNIIVQGKSILLNKCVTEPITNKERFGDSGLSGNLLKMEAGELYSIKSVYQSGHISLLLFLSAASFSLMKFIRRILIVQSRKLKKQKRNRHLATLLQ